MKRIEMIMGARKLVDECTRVQKGEYVLIVTDTITPTSIAEVLATACKEKGAEAVVLIMSPLSRDSGNEPPPPVVEAMQKAQVIFWTCSRSIYHNRSRTQALQAGARFFIFTEFTEDDMFKGAIEADFLEAKGFVEKVGGWLREAKEARIQTAAGTDLYLDFRGRPEKIVIHNGNCHHPGQSSGIILEAAISPKVGSAQGVIVCDASISLFRPGIVKEPVRATVRDGRIVEIDGGADARKLSETLEAMSDPMVYNVAELGVGCNPKAKVTGVKTQDKGVYGTCHIGVGSNITWGGTIKAATHFDLLMYAPKIVLDGKILLENYRFNQQVS